MNQARVPGGTRTGGQFTAASRPEAAVALVENQATVTFDDLDDLVGAFPGVGACVRNPPPDDAVGYHETLPVEQVAHWGAPMTTFASEYGCPACQDLDFRGDLPEPACSTADTDGDADPCEYRYVKGMIDSLDSGESFDPIVAYHRPTGHPLRDEQAPGQRDHEIDDGHHRISAACGARAASIDAVVFHDGDCCERGNR